MRKTSPGFSLAELLIVVAIIAVLVAVTIPIFTSKLEKSREAADAANIRGQYAEVLAEGISSGGALNADGAAFGKVTLKQKVDGWQDTSMLNNFSFIADYVDGDPVSAGTAWVSYDPNAANRVVIHFSGGSGNGGSGGSGDAGGGNGTETETDSSNNQYLAGQQFTFISGSNLHKASKLTVNIPGNKILTANTITVHIIKNPGNGQSKTETITLTPGVDAAATIPIDVKNNGSLDISFSETIDKNVANLLLSYFSVS